MFNDNSQPPPDLAAFATICTEAARLYGDDWASVEQHIKAGVNALPKEQRERLANELDKVLRYQPPSSNSATQ